MKIFKGFLSTCGVIVIFILGAIMGAWSMYTWILHEFKKDTESRRVRNSSKYAYGYYRERA